MLYKMYSRPLSWILKVTSDVDFSCDLTDAIKLEFSWINKRGIYETYNIQETE